MFFMNELDQAIKRAARQTNRMKRLLEEALRKAIQDAGGESELARKITARFPDTPTTRQAIHQWKICPKRRRAHMLELAGVDLRPDLG
jgi:hypothetical protein